MSSADAILSRLREYEQAITVQKRAKFLASEEQARTKKELDSAELALRAMHMEVAQGDRPEDDPALDEQVGKVNAIRGRIVNRGGEMVDGIASARREVAHKRAIEAERELSEFVRRHRDELLAALLAEGDKAVEAVGEAEAAVRRAAKQWDTVNALWSRAIVQALGVDRPSTPFNPLAGVVQAIGMARRSGIAPPGPRQLTTPAEERVAV